jgi:hypothetical protein
MNQDHFDSFSLMMLKDTWIAGHAFRLLLNVLPLGPRKQVDFDLLLLRFSFAIEAQVYFQSTTTSAAAEGKHAKDAADVVVAEECTTVGCTGETVG